MDKVIIFLTKIIGNDYLLVSIASAFPLIEIKGSILLGISKGLPPLWVLLLSYLGSAVVAPLILLCLRPLLNLIKKIPPIKKLAISIENRMQNKATRFKEKSKGKESNAVFLSLLIFVALPVPMTGVWSGAVIASFLNVDYVKSLVAIIVGNIISGLFVFSIALLFKPYVNIIFTIFLLAVSVTLVASIIYPIIDKKIKGRKAIKSLF